MQKIYSFINTYKYIVSLIAGSLVTLSFAPFFIFPAVIFSFVVAFILIENAKSIKEAFFMGWCFGFGKFTTSLYWFANALLVESEKFAWLIPLANLGLPAFFALYIAFAFCMTFIHTKHFMHRKEPSLVDKVVIFSIIFTLLEYLRAAFFTGFPWNLIGYSFGFSIELLQIASIIGIYGLSFLVILIAGALYLLLNKSSYKFVAFISFMILAGYLYGYNRLKLPVKFYDDVNLFLVQGNISQENKWKEDLRFENLSTYINLSKKASSKNYIIWPESAIPYSIETDGLLELISKIIPKNGMLITGTVRNDEHDNWWNSISFINPEGKILKNYNKSHLVPFGEYIPFRSILPSSIERLAHGIGDFNVGTGPETILIEPLPPVSPLICYEAIFPDLAVNKKNFPKWIVNLTNDAWFGQFMGPHQHFHMVRFRAVEQNLPIIRAANTGISAVIDGYGRIIKSLPLGERNVLHSKLPIEGKRSIYSKYGDRLILGILFSAYCYFIKRFYENS